jgi:EmrB/QacA subfamily drug resistance transporter
MRKWFPLIAVSIGTFMLLVDVTIVTVALPAIAKDLHASLDGLQWVLDAYALALAALLLGAGALADRHGRRRLYLGGTAVFAVASLVCAGAPDEGVLIGARFLQGVGGAAMFATTVALLSVAYQGRDRGIAFGVWGAVNGAAAAAGPIVGGLLTEHVGWRWIFLVNLPVSVLAVWFTVRGVSESHGRRDARFDRPGVVTFTVAAGAVTYALIRAQWTSRLTVGLFVLAAVALTAFLVFERAAEHPMLELALFRRLPFSTLMLVAVLVSAAAFAYLPFTTLWLQEVLGKGPVDAGLLGALPMSAAAFVVGAFGGRFLQRVDPRWTVGLGLLLIGAGDYLQSRLQATSSATVFVPGLVVAGVGVAIVLPTLSSATLGAVPHQRSGMAGGALNTFRQLGFAMGVAVFGAVFQNVPVLTGLHRTLLVAAALAVVAGLLTLVAYRRPQNPTTEETHGARTASRPAHTAS